MKLLKNLKLTKIESLWVTTRPHIRKELEDELSVFSYTLKPFSKNNGEQEIFLRKFWIKNLNLSEINEKRIEIYTEKLLDLVSRSIREKVKEFTSIPLEAGMLAEAFQKNFEMFYTNKNMLEPEFPKKLDLLALYEKFIKCKYENYLEIKKDYDLSKPGTEYEALVENFRKKHKLLALCAVIPEENLRNPPLNNDIIREIIKYKEEVVKGKENTGIVSLSTNDQLYFIHRKYADYFAALWFAENWECKKVNDFINEYIFKEENEVLRNFFDQMLADKSEIHFAIINNDIDKVSELLSSIGFPDKANRTSLHLAAAYGYEEIAKVLLDKLEQTLESTTLKTSVNAKDELFDWSPLTYADKKNHWNIAELLLQKGANGDHMFGAIRNVKTLYKGQETILHIAAKEGYVKFVDVLIKNGANVNEKNIILRTPLQLAALRGRKDVVKFLIEHVEKQSPNQFIEFINAKDDYERTSLHLAALGGSKDVVVFLINCVEKRSPYQLSDCINDNDNFGRTPLHLAAAGGSKDVLEFLINHVRETNPNQISEFINAKDKIHRTPLHLAAVRGRKDIVEFLFEYVRRTTPEQLIQFIDAKDNYERTSLHLAVVGGSKDVVECIINHVTTISPNQFSLFFNAKDNFGRTALHLAAAGHVKDVIEFLINHIKNTSPMQLNKLINARDNLKRNPLHLAVLRGRKDVIEFLIEHAAKSSPNRVSPFINAKDKNGRTALHLAAADGRTDVVEFLIEHVKKTSPNQLNHFINAKDKRGRTPLFFASMHDHQDVVELLIRH